MARRATALAALTAWVGLAHGQTPQFIPGGTPPEGTPGSVVTLRTAGQPERRLQILKTDRLPDGKILTEVRDLSTGMVFTIADTKLVGSSDWAKLPVIAPAAATPTLPGTTVPASGLPQAKPRPSDPLLGNAAQPEHPTLMGKLREKKTAEAMPAPVPTAPKQSGFMKALFGDDSEAQSSQPMMNKSVTPTPVKPVTAPATASNSGGLKAAVFGTLGQQPAETPTLMGKLFGGEKPTAPAQVQTPPTQVVRQPTTGVIRPNAAATNMTTRMTPPPAMPTFEQPVMATTITTTMAPQPKPAAPPMEMASLAPVSMDSRDPNFHVVPVKAMTMKQIEDMVKDLRMHAKPTTRLEAANSLASCPMAGMVEVRQILAEASYRDPVPTVRAHCIELLTKMNYDEPNYRKYVESLVNDETGVIQVAARNAIR